MMKKLLVSLLSALLCISVVAEPEIQSDGNQNRNDVKIDENGYVFVPPLKYHISDGKAEVKRDKSYRELESVIVPSEIRIGEHVYPVTSIGETGFSWCCELRDIEIPSSVTSIGDSAFCGCSDLSSINIPSSVTSIGKSTFNSCINLTSINIPSSVTSIGEGTFSDCISLTSINISTSVISIGESAFAFCRDLTSINVSQDNLIYSSKDGILYDKNKTVLIYSPMGKKGAVKIPKSVTSIEEGAFSSCRCLTRIVIPSSVKSIEFDAFRDCIGLKSIKIPSSVTSIGDAAFWYCENLDIIIDNSEKNVSVGKDAFEGCKSVKFLK